MLPKPSIGEKEFKLQTVVSMVQEETIGLSEEPITGQTTIERVLPKEALLHSAIWEGHVTNNYRLMMWLVIALAIGAIVYLYSQDHIDYLNKEYLKESVIRVISGKEVLTPEQRSLQLIKIAKSHNITVAALEKLIANEILLERQQIRDESGGYGPGVHIVKGGYEDRINPNSIRLVDGVMQFSNIEAKKGFQKPEDLKSDKSIYIEAAKTQSTDLAKANFVGYFISGTYLQGSDYAQTELLKQIERTPSGKSGWTGLTRVYSGYDTLGTVILEESDLLAAGGVALVPEGSLNEKVGIYPATLSRLRDNTGKTMTHIDWTDKNLHNYAINIQQTDDASIASLKRLAESIAKAGR